MATTAGPAAAAIAAADGRTSVYEWALQHVVRRHPRVDLEGEVQVRPEPTHPEKRLAAEQRGRL